PKHHIAGNGIVFNQGNSGHTLLIRRKKATSFNKVKKLSSASMMSPGAGDRGFTELVQSQAVAQCQRREGDRESTPRAEFGGSHAGNDGLPRRAARCSSAG